MRSSLTKDDSNAKTKDVKTRKDVMKCPHITSLVLIALVAIGTLGPMHRNINIFGMENLVFLKQEEQQIMISREKGPIPGCNLFSGKWIYDNVSYPLYKEEQCSFMGYKFPACEKNGRRKDLKYQNWRWQPHHCDIPRFDGSALLETLRGKKLIFVGDSLGRNQWESMLCLLISHFPPSSSSMKKKSWKLQSQGSFINFYAIEYNATVGFYWAPFLVESNSDSPRNHKAHNSTIRIKSIEKNGRQWLDADFLVFDSFAWWVVGHWFTILWGSFEGPDAVYKIAEIKPRLYEIALTTWSDWLEMQINPDKTKMFFMSHSPYHYGPFVPRSFHCISHKEPIFDEKYWPSSVDRDLMQIVESVIEKLEQRGVKVEYLNITQLSGYRVDAHPGQTSKTNSDCLHWCLPGVPDIWNQILYTYIMKS